MMLINNKVTNIVTYMLIVAIKVNLQQSEKILLGCT